MCVTIFVFLAKTGMTPESVAAALSVAALPEFQDVAVFASYIPLNTTHVVAKCYR